MKINAYEGRINSALPLSGQQAEDITFAQELTDKTQGNTNDSKNMDTRQKSTADYYSINRQDCLAKYWRDRLWKDVSEDSEAAEEKENNTADTASKESETKSNVIVKPDGSRVLIITTNVGGMETQMSLQISKPTDLPNGSVSTESEGADRQGITPEHIDTMDE